MPEFYETPAFYGHDAIIEAAAGTGKTYTLQKIVTYLLKNGLAPHAGNILLVTYTDKAAGELRDRIRRELSAGGLLKPDFEEMDISTIHSFCQRLLADYAFETGEPLQCEVSGADMTIIRTAVLNTIRSQRFADRYRDNFAQCMRLSGIADTDSLVAEICNTLKSMFTQGIIPQSTDFNREFASEISRITLLAKQLSAQENMEPLSQLAAGTFSAKMDDLTVNLHKTDADKCGRNFRRLNELLPGLCRRPFNLDALDVAAANLNPRVSGGTPANIKNLFDLPYGWLREIQELSELLGDIREKLVPLFKTDIAALAWEEYLKIEQESQIMTFDDMVLRAQKIIRRAAQEEKNTGANTFLDNLRKKYRYVLVDEFQDTDNKQWEIFNTVFSHEQRHGQNGMLLVVGDPKQAIYGFRGADLATYEKAKSIITGSSPLNKLSATYRCTGPMVAAYNVFFGKSGWFAQGIDGTPNNITYYPAEFPEQSQHTAKYAPIKLLESLRDDETVHQKTDKEGNSPAKTEFGLGNNTRNLPVFCRNAVKEIQRLLKDDNRDLPDSFGGEKRPFRPADFCFLVRSRNNARQIKKALAKAGIPYTQYKETGVFGSAEGESVAALLDYLAEPQKSGNLPALLLTPFYRIRPQDLEETINSLDDSFFARIDRWRFLARHRAWAALFASIMEKTGISRHTEGDLDFDRRYAAIRQIFDALLTQKERTIQNIGDFAELIRQWQTTESESNDNGMRNRESDKDCVQIMTMHAAKGLEFPVVFIADGFSGPGIQLSQEEKDAWPAETRRLYYVALTRAQYRLYLPWTVKEDGIADGIGSKGSPLRGGFLAQAITTYFANSEERQANVLRYGNPPPRAASKKSVENKKSREIAAFQAPRYPRNGCFHWNSYSGLQKYHQGGNFFHSPAAARPPILPRGSKIGDAFHELLERLCNNDSAFSPELPDFASIGNLENVGILNDDGELAERELRKPLLKAFYDSARTALIKHGLARQEEFADSVRNPPPAGDSQDNRRIAALMRMIWHVLNSPVKIGDAEFTLKDIPAKNRRAEVKFVIDEKQLISREQIAGIGGEGAINGSIDLFFTYQNRYYIADWKTTTLAAYDPETMRRGMEEHLYTLQSQIYSLAAEKWLGCGRELAGIAYFFVRAWEFADTAGQPNQGVFGHAAETFGDRPKRIGECLAECIKAQNFWFWPDSAISQGDN